MFCFFKKRYIRVSVWRGDSPHHTSPTSYSLSSPPATRASHRQHAVTTRALAQADQGRISEHRGSVDENWIVVVCMSAVGVSLSAGDDGGQCSGPVPAEAGLVQVEEIHITVVADVCTCLPEEVSCRWSPCAVHLEGERREHDIRARGHDMVPSEFVGSRTQRG